MTMAKCLCKPFMMHNDYGQMFENYHKHQQGIPVILFTLHYTVYTLTQSVSPTYTSKVWGEGAEELLVNL